MHGSFGRDNTANFMAAVGPDFKEHYVDAAPVGNPDLAPTVLGLLGLASAVPQSGAGQPLSGRVLAEALRGASIPLVYNRCRVASAPAADGRRTWLEYQQLGGEHYVDASRMAAVLPREPGKQGGRDLRGGPDVTRPVCRAEQAR